MQIFYFAKDGNSSDKNIASQGFLSLEGSIALVFGANIGTCATGLLASIGKPTILLSFR